MAGCNIRASLPSATVSYSSYHQELTWGRDILFSLICIKGITGQTEEITCLTSCKVHSKNARFPEISSSAGTPPCRKNCRNSLQPISKENGVYFRSTRMHWFRDTEFHFKAACKPLNVHSALGESSIVNLSWWQLSPIKHGRWFSCTIHAILNNTLLFVMRSPIFFPYTISILYFHSLVPPSLPVILTLRFGKKISHPQVPGSNLAQPGSNWNLTQADNCFHTTWAETPAHNQCPPYKS